MKSPIASGYLAVTSGKEQFYIPVEHVAEVSKSFKPRFLPGMKPGFGGVMRLRDELLGILSIGHLSKSDSNVVILNLSTGRMALVVDFVENIVNITLPDEPPQKNIKYVNTYGEINVFDIKSLESELA
jgi:chemotaxis signal transduction protein